MNTLTTVYLEMTDSTQLRRSAIADPKFRVLEVIEKEGRYNKFLYSMVGESWSWLDKLSWTDDEWKAYAEAECLRTFVAYYEGTPAGYFELMHENGEIEIAYFGMSPKFIGKGYGGALLSKAIEVAFEAAPKRVWVHTCSLDHPAALKNYISRGMSVYKTEQE